MTTAPKNKKVNVFVAGATGSGKSTLIAVLAQALNGAGHTTAVPPGTPSVSEAIIDLAEQFDVSFHEDIPPTPAEPAMTETKLIHVLELTRQMHLLTQESNELQALISSHQAKRRMIEQEITGRKREVRRLMGLPSAPATVEITARDVVTAAPATPDYDPLKDVRFVPTNEPYTYAPNTCRPDLPGHGTGVARGGFTAGEAPSILMKVSPGEQSAIDKLLQANLQTTAPE